MDPPTGGVTASVFVSMVCVRHMRMHMPQWIMPMDMAVQPDGHGLVRMSVVAVVMPVCMLVVEFFVHMRVTMGFRQVQHHTGQHQHAAQCHQAADRTVAERDRKSVV